MGVELTKALTLAKRNKPRQKREKPVKAVEAKPPIEPTPERAAKGYAEKAFVHNHEEGTKKEIWRIQSWHAMMHNRGKLNDDQFRVLQKYVDQWDIANRSPLKSNLNRTISDGDGGGLKYLDAVKQLRHWDARIGRQNTRELVLVCCEALGYEGAARALFGDSANSSDARRIKRRLIEKTIPALDQFMK